MTKQTSPHDVAPGAVPAHIVTEVLRSIGVPGMLISGAAPLATLRGLLARAEGAQMFVRSGDEAKAMAQAWESEMSEPWYGGAGLSRGIWERAWNAGGSWIEARQQQASHAAAPTEATPDVAFKPWHERHADVFSNEGDAWRAFLDARATISQAAAPAVAREPSLTQRAIEALRFYANGDHYSIDDEHQQFDTVSGEPVNWLLSERDDDCTMIEDGSIAKAALLGTLAAFEEPPAPIKGEVLGAVPADAGDAALTAAARDVLAERARQVTAEGWTAAHDDEYRYGALASAAGCYAMYTQAYPAGDPPPAWPWAKEWWKPVTERQNRVKAGALILAEIERLDRAEALEQGAQGGKGGEA